MVKALELRAQGSMAMADIEDHRSGRCSTPQFVLATCRAYYLARSSQQDAEGYRCTIEKYLGFPLPLREDWTLEQWTDFVMKRKSSADQLTGNHFPIFN